MFSKTQRPVMASENLPIKHQVSRRAEQLPTAFSPLLLEGSSMRRIVPETHAASREIMNSNPSSDTRVTNSDGFGCSIVGRLRAECRMEREAITSEDKARSR